MTLRELQKNPIKFTTIEEFRKLIEDMLSSQGDKGLEVSTDTFCTPYGNSGIAYYYTIKVTNPNWMFLTYEYRFNTDTDNLEDMRSIINEIHDGYNAYSLGYFACVKAIRWSKEFYEQCKRY